MPETQLKRINMVSSNFARDFKISAPVGEWAKGATNETGDVKTVQLMLQYVAQKRGRKDLDPLGIDGKISRLPGKSNTVKAIIAFQREFMSQPDGLVEPGKKTFGKLLGEVGGASITATTAAKAVMMAPHASDGKPPWLQGLNGDKVVSTPALLSPPKPMKPDWIEKAEKEYGQAEVSPGKVTKDHNPRIIQYNATTNKFKNEDDAWCASFVNWVLKEAGYQSIDGMRGGRALQWKTWGDGLSKPAVGAVAVIDWGGGSGHVGFVVGKDRRGNIVLLGGNQGHMVKYSPYKQSLIKAYRVPSGYQPTAEQYDLPIINTAEGPGGFSSTR